jgi:hemerythrin-like domain-containing protein
MVHPVAAWHQEHQYFRQLLALLQAQLDVFHQGGEPDFELMLDVMSHLRAGDACHHLREDEAFRRLVQRCPDRTLRLARLQQEHAVIEHAGEELQGLLEQAARGEVTLRSRIQMEAATFLVYYGNHMAVEEEDVLPLAMRMLRPADWEAVRHAAIERDEPVSGKDTDKRLRELRNRLIAQDA